METQIADLFDQFIEASTMKTVLSLHHRILNYSDLNPGEFSVFFPKLKSAVMTNRKRKNWKAIALFAKLDKKAAHRCYSNTKTPTSNGNQRLTTEIDQQQQQDGSNQDVIYNNNNALKHYNCLVIGSGPAGLRTAIELQLLGASKVIVVEKRSRFSRNNVLHLWPFVIDDLKSLGAKKFYGKFCAGSIDHISIRQLQLILLKICLMIGCDFRDSCSFLHLCPSSIKQPIQQQKENQSSSKDETTGDIKEANGSSDIRESISKSSKCEFEDEEIKESNDDFVKVSSLLELDTSETPELEISNKSRTDSLMIPDTNSSARNGVINLQGSRAHFESEYKLQEKELHSYEWDVIIGADGRRSTLSKFFPLKEFRGRLAIAITANFINRQTPAEASVSEISGLSFIYNQDMFNALAYDTNILLENICYYKDDTHYFVMTAKKKSLLERGVLLSDYATTSDLLSDQNVNREALLKYAKDAAYWTTGLEPLDFALNHYGQEDCAMFDFTSMYAASNACKALCTKRGGLTLVSLVGDSLLEPFWPTGSGCARGFLSSFDASWMCRQWAVNKCAVVLDNQQSTSSRSSRNHNRSITPTNSNESKTNKQVKPESTPTFNRLALSVMAERESIYRILAQTTSENLQQNYSHWTLNPHSRYPNLNRHLVTPSQVEHLVTNNGIASSFIKFGVRTGQKSNTKNSLTKTKSRRIKSPNNSTPIVRKSPKKLRSAGASPISQTKSPKGNNTKSAHNKYKSYSRNDVTLDDTYIEFEKSYNNLNDDGKGNSYYLNHHRNNCHENVDYDDLLNNPSISGIMPSSSNLLTLEARRARDIDECLKQRRQKSQLSSVRDHLIEQFRGDGRRNSIGDEMNRHFSVLSTPGGSTFLNEFRRLREKQQFAGKENSGSRGLKDETRPLTVFNSIRRCTSFAERVKSFENKLSTQSSREPSMPTTPKTPIDDVKNLPQFATLQEIFDNCGTISHANETKKSKMPIMKLSKDDWNVKCWEKRIAGFNKNGLNLRGSTKSLNKAPSMDSYYSEKPQKQVELFKDRIREMADKLKKTKDQNQTVQATVKKLNSTDQQKQPEQQEPTQGWVSHVRRKLINGVDTKNNPQATPTVPTRKIKKLFANDDDEDDESDKHYDHLCVNRPTNRYLSKNAYTSHLSRVRYDSATTKVLNRPPEAAIKQAYIANHHQQQQQQELVKSSRLPRQNPMESTNLTYNSKLKCSRCNASVEVSQGISFGGGSTLHRNCLRCSDCGITLRTNEIQYYLSLRAPQANLEDDEVTDFKCAICKPGLREDLDRGQDKKQEESPGNGASNGSKTTSSMRSREEFFSEKINYNEIYKNILDDSKRTNELLTSKIDSLRLSSSRETTPSKSTSRKSSSSLEYDDARSRLGTQSSDLNKLVDLVDLGQLKESPSPVTITLPLEVNADDDHHQVYGKEADSSKLADENEDKNNTLKEANIGFRIGRRETIDGSEQVTIILPPRETSPENKTMMDETELERILHLDQHSNSRRSSKQKNRRHSSNESSSNKASHDDDAGEDTSSDDESSKESKNNDEQPEGEHSSSLESPLDDDDEDEVDEGENSTYEDFLTSEEFGPVSEPEDNSEDNNSDEMENDAGSSKVNEALKVGD